MSDNLLYRLRVTTHNHIDESEPLPKNEAELNYQNRILVEVKATFGMTERHNWQIELVNDGNEVVSEFLLESHNNGA
jgi:hypothetical protein